MGLIVNAVKHIGYENVLNYFMQPKNRICLKKSSKSGFCNFWCPKINFLDDLEHF